MDKNTIETSAESQELAATMKSLKDSLKKAVYSERELNADDKNRMSQTVVAQITALINTAKELFSEYSETLAPSERQRLVASGVKNIGFIQASYMSAEGHVQFMPSYITIDSYTSDKEDFEQKRALLSEVNDFEQEIADSMLIASDIVYRDSLAYYNTLKEAVKQKVNGAEGEYNMLKTYFSRSKSKVSSETPTEAKLKRDVNSIMHGTKDGKIIIERHTPAIEKGKFAVVDTAHSPDISVRETVNETMKED